MLQKLETIAVQERPAVALSLVAVTVSAPSALNAGAASTDVGSAAALAAFKIRVDDLIGSHPIVNS
ncbi:MAG: hypothetical protein C0464_00170, partial [Cyanobacteria bacterium DS2.008]|nr:hypothetical protein [Cyanobacteria bacterium DS2.008]